MLGLRPVVEIMTINFSLLALDQIVNHAAKIYGMFGGQNSVPMVIRTPGGGASSSAPPTRRTSSCTTRSCRAESRGAQHAADAAALLRAAIRDDDPVLFLENLGLYNTKAKSPTKKSSAKSAGPPSSVKAPTSPSSATPDGHDRHSGGGPTR